MIIQMQIKDIMKLDLWEEYCEQSGTNLYAVAEGMDEDEVVTVSISASKSVIILSKQI